MEFDWRICREISRGGRVAEIEFIRYLLDEVEAELEYEKKYKESKAEFDENTEREGFRNWDHPYVDMRQPVKSKIKDNLKMIRRLALKIERGDDNGE